MKKILSAFVGVISVVSAQAQNINPGSDYNTSRDHTWAPKVKEPIKGDSLLSNWCLDVNLTGGVLMENITANDPTAHYLDVVNSSFGNLKFTKGSSFGIDGEIAYFFNKHRNWGIGTGIWYMEQGGTVTMDNFHVEYRSTDYAGNTFRQVVTADNSIQEKLHTSNLNIPLLLKYKIKGSKSIGFAVDAGLMFNITENNAYTSNASFDYEGIYKYVGTEGNISTVYDNGVVPGASDVLYTKNQYLSTHSPASIQNYFNTLRAQGNNLGLGVQANSNTGNVSYTSGSVGFLIRPAISFYLSNQVALNLGAYYLYQDFMNNAAGNYKITDKIGQYSSILNTVTKDANNSVGISFGVRVFLCKAKEAKVAEPELAPEEDKVIETPPPAPQSPPEETADVAPLPDLSTPILFDLDKTTIKTESYPILEEAVIEVNENKNAHLVVHGYTDNTGGAAYNRALSRRRANAVKTYLREKGVKPKLIKTVGHGSKSPAASNSTPEGRMQNRRAVIKLK